MADVKDVKDTCAPRSNRRDKQVYTYDAKWDIYALNWSNRAGDEYAFRFAIGSFIEEYRNKIKVSLVFALIRCRLSCQACLDFRSFN